MKFINQIFLPSVDPIGKLEKINFVVSFNMLRIGYNGVEVIVETDGVVNICVAKMKRLFRIYLIF